MSCEIMSILFSYWDLLEFLQFNLTVRKSTSIKDRVHENIFMSILQVDWLREEAPKARAPQVSKVLFDSFKHSHSKEVVIRAVMISGLAYTDYLCICISTCVFHLLHLGTF